MAFLGEAVARLVLDASGFNRELGRAAGNLDRFRGRADAIADGLNVIGRGFTAAGVAITVGLGAAVKQAADFQEQMQNVAAISPEVAANMDQMADGVLRIASETARMPTDLASGLYDIISAAIPAGQALDVLEASAKAANAGLTTVAVAARVNAAILNSGIQNLEGQMVSLNEAMDISFQAVNRGVFTYEEWAAQIGDVLPLAASLGVSFEEVSAAAATITQNGVSLAETTTQINAVFTALLKPTKQVEETFNAMGYESGLALIQTKGFTGAIAEMDEYLESTGDNTSDFSKNIRAIRGFLGLTNDEMVRYNENLEFMRDATGATDYALRQQSNTFNYALRELRANLAALGVSLGTIFLPALTALTKGISALVKVLNSIPEPIKAVIGVLAGIAAAALFMAGGIALATAGVYRIGLAMRYLQGAGLRIIGPFMALMIPLRGISRLAPRAAAALVTLLGPISLLRLAVRSLSFVLGAGRAGLVGIIALILSPITRIRHAFLLLVAAVNILTLRLASFGATMRALFASLFPFATVLFRIAVALTRLIPAALGVAAAFLAWRVIDGPINAVYQQLQNLLSLGKDFRDFFDFSKETRRVQDNTEALRKNRHEFRNRIAEALGIDTKRLGLSDSFFGAGPDATLFDPGSRVAGRDVAYLKQLDNALKDSGYEIRAWSNKFKIGRRAYKDFIDIAAGRRGGREVLKTFRARLNDVFGREAGGEIYEGTKRIRQGLRELNQALEQRFGIENMLSLRNAVLGVIVALNAASQFMREQVVPVIGRVIGSFTDMAGAILEISADLISGDFVGAFDKIVDFAKTIINDIVIDGVSFKIRLIAGTLEWAAGEAWDIASSIWNLISQGRGVEQLANVARVTLENDVIPYLEVGIPRLIGWVENAAGNMAQLLSSYLGRAGAFAGNTIDRLVSWTIEIGPPVIANAHIIGSFIGDQIASAIRSVSDFTQPIVESIQGRLRSLSIDDMSVPGVFAVGSRLGTRIRDEITDGVQAVISAITSLPIDWSAIRSAIRSGITTAIEEGPGFLASIGVTTIRIGAAIVSFVGGLLSGVIFGEDITFPDFTEKIKTFLRTTVWNAIKTALTFDISEIEVSTTESEAESSGRRFGRGLADFIIEAIRSIVESALEHLSGGGIEAEARTMGISLGESSASSLGPVIDAFVKGFFEGFARRTGEELVRLFNDEPIVKDFRGRRDQGESVYMALWNSVVKPFFDFSGFSYKDGSILDEIITMVTKEDSFIDDVVGLYNAVKEVVTGDIYSALRDAEFQKDVADSASEALAGVGDAQQKGLPSYHPSRLWDDIVVPAFKGMFSFAKGDFDQQIDDFLNNEIRHPLMEALVGPGSFVDDAHKVINEVFDEVRDALTRGFTTSSTNADAINPFASGDAPFLTIEKTEGFGTLLMDEFITPIITEIEGIPGKIADNLPSLDIFSEINQWFEDQIANLDFPDPPELPDWITDFAGWVKQQIKGGEQGRSMAGSDDIAKSMQLLGSQSATPHMWEIGPTGELLPIAIDGLEVTVGSDVKYGFGGVVYSSLAELLTASIGSSLSGGEATTGGTGVKLALPPIEFTGVSEQMTTLKTTINQSMIEVVSGVTANINNLRTAASTGFSLMVGETGAHVGSLVTNTTNQFTNLDASASGSVGSLATNVSSTFSTMSANAQGITNGMVAAVIGIINHLASSGYGAAYSAGSAIGAGLRDGMNSMIGAVQAAASNLASAAENAASRWLGIASPSKLFTTIGAYIGEGMVLGMDSQREAVRRAGTALAKATVPYVPGAATTTLPSSRMTRDNRPNVNFSGATFVVPNMDTAAQIESYFLNLSR